MNHPEKLKREFYTRRDTLHVARSLLGKRLVVPAPDGTRVSGFIVETEAYLGPEDRAAHSYNNRRTPRTEMMFGEGGHAYVYFIYGMYDMFNVVAGAVGNAQAVLVRAAEPLDGWDADLTGPGKLCRAMKITRADNGVDLTGATLFLTDNPGPAPRVVRTVRIGVDYAKDWKDAELRVLDADSKAVSKPRP